MNEKLQNSMNEAVLQTFGEMAFIDALPTGTELVEHHQIMILEITKPERGTIFLLMTTDCKQQVVENIHGDSWDSLPPGKIDDCLLELLNVLGGTFLSFYYGENTNYSLSFPQVMFDDSEMPDLKNYSILSYDAEGALFSIAVRLETQRSN